MLATISAMAKTASAADGPRNRLRGVLETSTMALPIRHRQPIGRKPFYHFRPGATTLTLAAPGCTFRCDYCQNADVAQAGAAL
jgi:pyruvate formate lyase activating enzyme